MNKCSTTTWETALTVEPPSTASSSTAPPIEPADEVAVLVRCALTGADNLEWSNLGKQAMFFDGKRVALSLDGQQAVVDVETYDDILETAGILATPDLMDALKASEKDIAAGRTVSWDEVKEELDL